METLKNIFLYDQESPLLFTRLYFWGFYAVVLAIYSAIYKKKALRNAYLFLVSLFFYYKTGGLFFFILIFSTVTNFFIGKAIYDSRSLVAKKLFVALSVFLSLGVLAFFKYDYFFTETINTVFNTNLEVITHAAKWSNVLLGTHFDIGKILPPVGISFFTFQTISYTVDVYLEKVKPVRNIADFGFYVSFFPQLVAGPIVRAAQFIPQLYKNYSLTRYEFGLGVYLILKGLMKKMFVGDFIAVNLIDRVFADPITYTGFENLMALYGYSLQVYCDFSGYTDIAIGVALLLGFYLPKNFDSPYKAKSCGEFWKRWHISLSSWLKDYLYIPMGGNRGGSLFTYFSLATILIFIILLAGKLWLAPLFIIIIVFIWLLVRLFPGLRLTISTNINIMMTMLLGGLWHGSSWMFVLWGGLNGVGVVVYKFWKKISPYENSTHWLANFWKIFITFNFITFTRIWFRGESMQGTYDLLNQVSSSFGWLLLPEMVTTYWKVFLVMIFGYVVHWLPESLKIKYRDWFINTPVYLKIIICTVIVFIIYQSLSAELQPFIYFQF
jgi:D-alanyl-lipoteichoic acid acyltransferase DltB (MBOAT superfamily)